MFISCANDMPSATRTQVPTPSRGMVRVYCVGEPASIQHESWGYRESRGGNRNGRGDGYKYIILTSLIKRRTVVS